MGNYSGYRKRSSRLINCWLNDKPEETKKSFWYIYLLLEKATINLRADPIGVAHDLWDSNIFNIEDLEKIVCTPYELDRVVSRSAIRQKIVIKSHKEAIEKAVEIHRNLSDSNRLLLKELGYY